MTEEIIYSKKEARIIVAITISSILPLLDGSIVNVIMPELAMLFNVEKSRMQWIVTAYFLASLAGLLLSSWFQDRMGGKTVWIISSIIFMAGSFLAGLSNQLDTLIFSRLLQGVGAGMLLPLSQTIIANEFGKSRMKSVMGLVAVPAVFAPAVGPLFGAFFTGYISWRVLFFINIPLVIIAIAVGFSCLSCSVKSRIKFSSLPFCLFSISLGLLFYSFEEIKVEISLQNCILLGISLVLLFMAFLANAKSPVKLINFHEFRKGNYALSMVMGLAVSFLFYSFMIFYPLTIHFSPNNHSQLIALGLLLSMQGVGAWAGRKFIYCRIVDKSPFFIISPGVIVSTVSLPLFLMNNEICALGFFIRGIGLGIATIACLTAPMQWADQQFINDTSIIIRLLQQLGGAIGGVFAGMLVFLINTDNLSLLNAWAILFTVSAMIWIVISLGSLRIDQQSRC